MFQNNAGDIMAEKCYNDLDEQRTFADGEIGGYDCDFVESPADDLLCKICHFPARDPVLATCCGHNFCKSCLECYHQSRVKPCGSCPYCHEEKFHHDSAPCGHERFHTVPDKRTKRYVLNLKVFCPHKYHGCTWTGELQSVENHLNENSKDIIGCPFTELWCSNGCGAVMQRRQFEGHLKSECELREVNCIYCKITGIYQWISGDHQEECPKYPVECPNHCEVGHVRREEISGHLEECPLAIVDCPYAAVGCESVVRRKEEMKHVLGSVGQHMEYNKATILDIQTELERLKKTMSDRLDRKEEELESVKKELRETKEKLKRSQEIQSQLIIEKGRELNKVKKNAAENDKTLREMIQQFSDKLRLDVDQMRENIRDLQTGHLRQHNYGDNQIVPVIVKLTEFQKYEHHDNWYSPGFYTKSGGYKMCLRVFPYGVGLVSDSCVSVSARLMKGDHDDHLAWPVEGTLTVQLLNQLGDSNHSEPVEFHFDGCSSNCERVKVGVTSDFFVLCSNFMPHGKLSYDADKKCQYLKDDCVVFRICNFHAVIM